MRLFIKFIVTLVILMLLLPLPPLAVVAAAVATLYVLEYWRAKNIALSNVIREKYVNARQRMRERIGHDPRFEAETEEEALEIDELTEALKDELDKSDQLSDSWIAKAERHRATIRSAIWRSASWPIRKFANLLLSLFGGDKP